jgi:MFS family permease
MGIWNASIPLGSAIGVLMGGIIAVKLGWKHAFGIVAVPGLIVSILFLFVKDYKTVDLSFVDINSRKVRMEKKDIIREFMSRPSVLFTYFGIAAVIFVTTSLLTWLPSYFEKIRSIPQAKAGQMASAVMALAIVGAPLGGYLTDLWRRKLKTARLVFPALTTFMSAVVLFIALFLLKDTAQYAALLLFGILVLAFISGAAAVTQDVIHPGLRATSYAIAVLVQNLLGASASPIVIGKIYDLTNIRTALNILPVFLLIGSLLFWLGSRHYIKDLEKVTKVDLHSA